MKQNFQAALKIELVYEGGKDDDPVDPGGRTNQGIIQREYSAYRIRKGLAARDVFLMENAERDEIYKTQYFDRIRFDDLPPGVDLVIVDGAINSGPSQSIKWVQRALGINADGVLGEVTMQRIQTHPDHDLLIRDILERRLAFLRALKTFYHFGAGWTARVNNLRTKGQAWAMGSVGPTVVYVPNGNKKAMIVDAKPLPVVAAADSLASGGAVTTALTSVQSTLTPLQGMSPTIDHVLTGLVVAGVVAGLVGAGLAWYLRKRRTAIMDVLDMVPSGAPMNNWDVPQSVMQQYDDPNARGSETGNIAAGAVTMSGRTAGDAELRVNPKSMPTTSQITTPKETV